MPEGLKETPLAKRYRKSSYRVTILTKNKNHTGKKKNTIWVWQCFSAIFIKRDASIIKYLHKTMSMTILFLPLFSFLPCYLLGLFTVQVH